MALKPSLSVFNVNANTTMENSSLLNVLCYKSDLVLCLFIYCLQ